MSKLNRMLRSWALGNVGERLTWEHRMAAVAARDAAARLLGPAGP